MRKKRILLCNEASFLNTGYATYGREVLKRLHSTGKYEIAELACYADRNDPRGDQFPWKMYGNMPNRGVEEQVRAYDSSPTNQFGEWLFDEVCLDFLPDIVADIRDFWMIDFEERSPFRPFYNWVIMPTVDAYPQKTQWLATYANADAVFNYSDWAVDVLKDQSGGKINCLGSAPPSADEAYKPVGDKKAHKQKMGFDPDTKIIGTVMRNQRRKLFPDLFEAFRKFLDVSEDKNVVLYCHTSYPDVGWDIPELIQRYNLSKHLVFTYVCTETNRAFPSFFNDSGCQSPFTGNLSARLSNVQLGVSYEFLSDIMNLFDVYIQYANSEGFGLPQVEAAACGVPVMSVDYSAMESVIRKLGGVPLKVKAKYKELETGCMRAVPDNDNAAQKIKEFFDKPESMRLRMGFEAREAFEKYYQWDMTAKRWEECFDSFEIRPEQETWRSPLRIKQSNTNPPPFSNSRDAAQWLITETLGEPERLNSYMEARLIRDLNYKTTTETTGGMYFNEQSAIFSKPSFEPFDVEKALNHFKILCERRNKWEETRARVLGL